MKRKSVIILGACMTLAMAAGCGDQPQDAGTDTEALMEGQTEAGMQEGGGVASVDIEYQAEDYVTLGDYMGIDVSLNEADYQVTEEDVNSYADQMILYSNPYVADESRTVVEKDDIVDADYVGKKDGEAFDGGSAENQIIDVAKNASVTGSGYIEGFTDGLIGAKVGESVDCEVTFPENYGSEELKGQTVVFTFTVNSVGSLVTRETLTDEYVREKLEMDSVEAFYADIRGYLEESAQSKRESDIRTAVIQAVTETCSVSSLPEGVLDARVDEYVDLFQERYCPEGTDFAEFLQTNYNVTEDEFYSQNRESLETSLTQELIFEAIAKKENLEFDQDGYDQYISDIVSGGGYESENTLYESYGKDMEYGKKYFEKIYMVNKSCNMIMENANVNYEQPAETEQESEAE